jgi:hypothetical protein
MDTMRVTVRAGQKPTNEQVLEIRAAAKRPITYTEDCPESTPAALAEFAAKARELRGLPVTIEPDPVYNPANMRWLKESIAQMNRGEVVQKTFEELEIMAR